MTPGTARNLCRRVEHSGDRRVATQAGAGAHEDSEGRRHLGRGHRRTLVVGVLVGVAGKPSGTDNALRSQRPGAARPPVRPLGVPARRDEPPLGRAERARVKGDLVVWTGGADDDDVDGAVRCAPSEQRRRRVAGRDHPTTHLMPALTSSSAPLPLEESALATTSCAPGATPATPIPLLVSAAMIPLTWVPWPWSSWALPWHNNGSSLAPMQFVLATTLPARSMWVRSIPVSTTPTITPTPVAFDHAGGAPILVRFHCSGK